MVNHGPGLSPRALCLGLMAQYSAILVYGIVAAVLEVPSFVIAGGRAFAAVWALTVFALAALALLGVARTWHTGRARLEKWTTAAFVCVFMSYTFALLWRGIFESSHGSIPLSIIPAALCVFPTIRYYSLVIAERIAS